MRRVGQATPFPFPATINVAFLKMCVDPSSLLVAFFSSLWSMMFLDLAHRLDKMSNFCLQRKKKHFVPSADFSLSFVLSCKHVIRVKWGAFSIWEEMKAYIGEVGSILIFNNHIWWWHQVYTWYRHGAFPYKCRIHFSEGTQPYETKWGRDKTSSSCYRWT